MYVCMYIYIYMYIGADEARRRDPRGGERRLPADHDLLNRIVAFIRLMFDICSFEFKHLFV